MPAHPLPVRRALTAAAAESMREQASGLTHSVSVFKLDASGR